MKLASNTYKAWIDTPLGIAALVLLTAIVAYLVAANQMMLALSVAAAPLGVAFVLAVLGNPYFGFYALFFYTFIMFMPGRLLRADLPIGIGAEFLTVLVLMSALLRKKVQQQKIEGFLRQPVSIMLIIYSAYLLIEFFNPNMRSMAGLVFYYRKVLAFLLVYYIAYLLLDDLQKIVRFFKFWLIMSVLAGLYACKQQWFDFFPFEMRWLMSDPHKVRLYYQGGMFRKMSFLSDPAASGILLGYTAVIALVLSQFKPFAAYKQKLYFATIALLLGAIYSGTRTSYIVFAIGVVIYILMNFQRKRTLIFTGVSIFALAFILFGPINNAPINRVRTLMNGTNDASLKVRDENRELIRPYMLSHPMGGGLATNGVEGERFNPGHELAGFPTDSGYLKFALEAGWIGLIILCLLYFVMMQQCIHHYYQARNPTIKALYCAMAAALFAQIVAHYGQIAIGQMPGILFFFAIMAIIGRLKQFDDPSIAWEVEE
ncbi:MAG: O-antigen ligase family protein [Chitinophagaceae bacterium]|nr:O-antigen ligase family protein [Chitinophagaceae bacterium]